MRVLLLVIAAAALAAPPGARRAGAQGPAAAPPAELARHEYAEVHMGVATRVVLYAADERAAREAARAAFARVAALEDVMSDWRPGSELRRLERRPGAWVPVSAPLYAVLARAVAVARATGGAFDPTLGPLVALWREARRARRLPDPAAFDAARARVGWRRLALDPRRRRVRLAAPGMRLDLGGIAKGYILQDALGVLRARGVTRALLEAGGDVVAGDAPPGAAGWRVDVAGGDAGLAARAAALARAAVSTSGPTAQFVEIGGVRYSHVLDPRTGLGLRNARAATVVAPHGATADALSTALTVVDPAEVPRVLARFPGARATVRDAERADPPAGAPRDSAHAAPPAPGAPPASSTSSTSSTASAVGPCAPTTSACSMSAVLDGPATKAPNGSAATSRRA
jgi:thiamine biosynthesis lipoprotein